MTTDCSRFQFYRVSLSWAMCITDKYLWKTSPNKLRGKATTRAISKMEFFVTLVNAVNYCHKEIHCRCWRGPIYVSETSYYKKRKNEQQKDNVDCNKNLVKQFFRGTIFRGQFSLGVYFQREIFRGAIFSGAFFRGAFFLGVFFRTPVKIWVCNLSRFIFLT